MLKPLGWLFLSLLLCVFCKKANGQQDVDFHLTRHLLSGKKVISVKRDFYDPYLWVLTQNDEVYRINSLTFAIDDYTPTFAAYNNFQFTDIAGRSQDTVFIGTNSSNILEYQKGKIKTIGQANQISGSINQVGMDYRYESTLYNQGDPLRGHKRLIIATTTNLYFYDDDTEQTTLLDRSGGNNKLFEATYRNEGYSNFLFNGYYDSVDDSKAYPVLFQSSYTSFGGGFWYNKPEYGYNITAGYFIKSVYNDPSEGSFNYDYNEVIFLNELWGTENGLMQSNWNESYFSSSAHRHYLDGIKVNKITSIYGLAHFPSILRENVLIGTDQGFYFTNSAYHKYTSGNLNDYNTFTFNTDIGNQHINDICVDAESYSATTNIDLSNYATAICEDAVWVAADNGLYLLSPDYTPYISSNQIKAINFKYQSDTLSTLNLCAAATATATINKGVYAGNTIQWYKNGVEIKLAVQDTLAITEGGSYNAVLYDPCANVHMETNRLKVNIISAPVFAFNYPDKLKYCDSRATTLKTTNNPGYHYRWYSDGVLNGDTTYQYTVTQNGKYKIEVSACSNSWVFSKEIEVDLVNLPVPVVTMDKTKYCAGDLALLTVNVPADPGYTINWYKDGSLINSDFNKTAINATESGGYSVTLSSTIADCTRISNVQGVAFIPSPVVVFNYPDKLTYCAGTPLSLTTPGNPDYHYRWYRNGILTGDTLRTEGITKGGTYKVEASICENSWVPSKDVQIDLIAIPVPEIQTDKKSYCVGDNATLSILTPASNSYTINWYRDNIKLSDYTNKVSLNTAINGSYTATITNNETNTDGTACTQTSAVQTILFNPHPTISINQIQNTTLCNGQNVDLKATYANGTILWSTGQTTDQISVNSSGVYKATVTSTAGCVADTSSNVQLFSLPVLAIKDTSICAYTKGTVTLNAPAGYSKYIWNNQGGSRAFTVSTPQTVTLTVTDDNGCEASQKIVVASRCADLHITNTFTPNGDGINDTWAIAGIENDNSVFIKVFTRYGLLVYQSSGYYTPWNGQYNGKQLPAGIYYYILTAENGKQTFSGSVTIIY